MFDGFVFSDLKGKRVLVTGGSTGIGAAIVSAFAEQGARVAIHFNESHDAAAALQGKHSENTVLVHGDLARRVSAHRWWTKPPVFWAGLTASSTMLAACWEECRLPKSVPSISTVFWTSMRSHSGRQASRLIDISLRPGVGSLSTRRQSRPEMVAVAALSFTQRQRLSSAV